MTDGIQIADDTLLEILLQEYFGGVYALVLHYFVALAEQVCLLRTKLQPVELSDVLLLVEQGKIGIELYVKIRVIQILSGKFAHFDVCFIAYLSFIYTLERQSLQMFQFSIDGTFCEILRKIDFIYLNIAIHYLNICDFQKRIWRKIL